MDKPIVADNNPIIASLEEGQNYLFCTCGLSKKQPFCDGSHKSSSPQPLKFTANATTQKWMCMCKHTGNPPYCDGTHQRFSKEDVGKSLD